MLDKTKTYIVSSTNGETCRQDAKYGPVKILFEDDVSFYVACPDRLDKRQYGMRYSLKKFYYNLKEIPEITRLEVYVRGDIIGVDLPKIYVGVHHVPASFARLSDMINLKGFKGFNTDDNRPIHPKDVAIVVSKGVTVYAHVEGL